jgi:soluble lytic murein transglycosylase-like protein
MFVTVFHGPALVLASIVTLFGFLPFIGGETPAQGAATPIVQAVEPTVTPLATPMPTTVIPEPTTDSAVSVVPAPPVVAAPSVVPAPPVVVAPRAVVAQSVVSRPPVASQPPHPEGTRTPAAPSPTPTPRMYPTNREVGILRPASTPTPAPYIGQKLGPRVPGKVARWEDEILGAARRYKLDPNLIAALMQTESQGEPGAVSPANAVGLLQVVDGPEDPEENILLGTKMLVQNLRLFDEDLELALAAYNAGPRNVLKHKGVPPFAETEAHVERTLASYERFRQSS